MNISSNETLYTAVIKLTETLYEVCYDAPPKTVSDGLWAGHENGRTPMKSFFPMFELQVLIIFVLTQICRFLLKPLSLPSFIPQMVAGLIMSISFEIESLQPYMGILFPFGSHDVISAISSIGFVLFIFIYGVQMDFSMITRTGNKAWAISIIGLFVPLFAGFTPRILLSDKLHPIGESYGNDINVALASHLSSFAVIASLLDELKIQNSELGRLTLSSALVTDTLSKILSTIGVTIASNPDMKVVTRNLFSVISFAILIPLIGRPAMFWIIKHTPEGRPVRDSYIYIIISMVFAFGVIFVKIDQAFILGAFILGLSVPEGPPLGSALVKKLQLFATSFFLPIYVTTSVLKADFSMDLLSSSSVLITCLVILGIHLVKIAACLIASLYCNLPLSDALSLALILNTKGVVEIGIYHGLYDDKVLDGQTYGVMMISIMIIACIVQWCVKLLYDPSKKYAGYQKRNIMNLKPNSELRILATIHKQNHISPVTDFLDLCCPTTEDSIMVDVLHLIELVGRALPVFLHHGLQRQESSSSSLRKSYSDDLIMAFDIYEHENENAISVNTYTAISPAELMYEDVCNLALDKVASMIILPFHLRWSSDGGVESDDKKIRTLNLRVLEIAPCSVGILVTRASKGAIPSHQSSSSCTRLAVIYLGGGDDEEVLCIAKRAIKNPKTRLVVYRLVAKEHEAESEDSMEMEGGNDVLREVKNAKNVNVRYEEVLTKDGSETASFLGKIAKEHDFFIVGRRHGIDSPQTEGLTVWSEFPELGVIGDFLSSPDLESHASIFVVQQQLSRQTRSGWML